MAESAGWFRAERAGEALAIAVGGEWTLRFLGLLDAPLRRLNAGGARDVVIDLQALERLDTGGAWLLQRTAAQLRGSGIPVRFNGARPDHQALLTQAALSERPPIAELPAPPIFVRQIARIGKGVFDIGAEARDLLGFFGLTCITISRGIRHPTRLRLISIVSHMERTGYDALPIVGLLSFLIGVVIAFQGADQLRRFGAELFTVNLLGISILREMGVLLTAIIVAGRSGSAFTAEIGTMKVNEEVDAMRTIGLDPAELLVLPRLFALTLTLPLLAFYADIMGLVGGAVMSMATLDISLGQFLRQLQSAIPINSFWVGMIKAPVFAFVIAMVGCYEGLKVARSAESVGRLTTRSVVQSIFLVILLDAAFSVLFTYLHF